MGLTMTAWQAMQRQCQPLNGAMLLCIAAARALLAHELPTRTCYVTIGVVLLVHELHTCACYIICVVNYLPC